MVLVPTGLFHRFGRYRALTHETAEQHDPEESRSVTKLIPIALVSTAALWLVVILITDFPAWTLAVYVALLIPAIQRFSPSGQNDPPN